jgi:hypothetical protein
MGSEELACHFTVLPLSPFPTSPSASLRPLHLISLTLQSPSEITSWISRSSPTEMAFSALLSAQAEGGSFSTEASIICTCLWDTVRECPQSSRRELRFIIRSDKFSRTLWSRCISWCLAEDSVLSWSSGRCCASPTGWASRSR